MVVMQRALPLIALLAVMLIPTQSAYADVNNAGVLDNILNRYSTAASGWASVITSAASRLFWSLVTISMVWTFGIMALRRADIGEFFAEFIRFTVFTGFFWWLLINGPGFANSIIDSMRQLSSSATGLTSSLSPSGIVDIGFEILKKTLDSSSFLQPVDSAIGIISALIILVVLAVIGVNILLLLAGGWILAYGGVFFLGFGGSRWTSDIAINYFKTVLGVATQLFSMILIVGIGKTFLDDYAANMSNNPTLNELAVMLIVAIVLFLLATRVPQLISGIITGATVTGSGVGNFSAGALVGTAMGATGVATAAAATGGAVMAAGMANAVGGAQAMMAAVSKGADIPAGGSSLAPSSSNNSQPSTAATSSTPFGETAGFVDNSGSSSPAASSATSDSPSDGGFSENMVMENNTQSPSTASGPKSAISGAVKATSSNIKNAAQDRVNRSTMGKLANSIRTGSQIKNQPNPLMNSTATQLDAKQEIASFVDKGSKG